MSQTTALDFAPDMLRVQRQAPSPLPRVVMYVLLALLGVMIVWAFVGRLDIVATAQGKLVPQSFLKIVQPAEQGIVREILVKDGDTVARGRRWFAWMRGCRMPTAAWSKTNCACAVCSCGA